MIRTAPCDSAMTMPCASVMLFPLPPGRFPGRNRGVAAAQNLYRLPASLHECHRRDTLLGLGLIITQKNLSDSVRSAYVAAGFLWRLPYEKDCTRRSSGCRYD